MVLATLLFLVDAVWLGQGIISVGIGIWLLLVRFPLSYLPRHAAARHNRLRNIAIYCGAITLVMLANVANSLMAKARAGELVAAVESFKANQGRFPRNLDELTPHFIGEVPRARYTLSFGHFHYLHGGGEPVLMYVDMPPFGRPAYSFASRRWTYLD